MREARAAEGRGACRAATVVLKRGVKLLLFLLLLLLLFVLLFMLLLFMLRVSFRLPCSNQPGRQPKNHRAGYESISVREAAALSGTLDFTQALPSRSRASQGWQRRAGKLGQTREEYQRRRTTPESTAGIDSNYNDLHTILTQRASRATHAPARNNKINTRGREHNKRRLRRA